MRITAELAPLEGKYYGSKIIVRSPDGGEEWIMVWCNIGNFDPSEREFDGGEYEICDNHYESVAGYEISKAIVKALNGLEIPAARR